MTTFALLHLYTRREIAEVLGGGVQDYLPHHDGRIVCACLSRDLNPDAPDVILAGTGPDIVRWAEAFASQREFVPVFLKRATNAWQFVGRYRVESAAKGTNEISRWEAVSGRTGDISMILYLKDDKVS